MSKSAAPSRVSTETIEAGLDLVHRILDFTKRPEVRHAAASAITALAATRRPRQAPALEDGADQ
ncbi:hypothetical protein [Frigoribacterium sp. VKM Ac-2530]|uniref:hypothetical protein n=1 Tax=Frigoribacterium sp. VKM Ac-2530 TaxID=2783822 RepID=UPI00188CDAAA|nr:hypothetical protein [Frigoribacterium sp. VKM Ac-2530]MBF4578903.1 hypothetical protein [Frigoribacterium sp. VKM Ac-2530]